MLDETDEFFIGINCFGICGDADGDGDPASTSLELDERGGVDVAAFGDTESCLVGLDLIGVDSLMPDQVLDVVVGYPNDRFGARNTFFCFDNDGACFGFYSYERDGSLSGARIVSSLLRNFLHPAPSTDITTIATTTENEIISSTTTIPSSTTTFNDTNATDNTTATNTPSPIPQWVVDNNPLTSSERPDLIFTVREFSALKQLLATLRNINNNNNNNSSNDDDVWHVNVAAYCGSNQDDGIGEDFVPQLDLLADLFTRRYNIPTPAPTPLPTPLPTPFPTPAPTTSTMSTAKSLTTSSLATASTTTSSTNLFPTTTNDSPIIITTNNDNAKSETKNSILSSSSSTIDSNSFLSPTLSTTIATTATTIAINQHTLFADNSQLIDDGDGVSTPVLVLTILIAVVAYIGIALLAVGCYVHRREQAAVAHDVSALPLGYVDGTNEEFDSCSTNDSAWSESDSGEPNPNDSSRAKAANLSAMYDRLEEIRDSVVASDVAHPHLQNYQTVPLHFEADEHDDQSSPYNTKIFWD